LYTSNLSRTLSETEAEESRDREEAEAEAEECLLTNQHLVERWNLIPGVKTCKQATDRLAARLNELRKEKSAEWWDTFFAEVQRSQFLTGRTVPTNGRPVFRADLFWATGPVNLSKILSGKYADDETTYDPLREQVKFLLGDKQA